MNTMKKCERALVLLGIAGIALTSVIVPRAGRAEESGGNELVVIVHPSTPKRSMSKSEIRDAFLGEVRVAAGARVHAVDLAGNPPVRRAFLRIVLDMSETEFARYWIKRRYVSGDTSPEKIASAPEVVALIEVLEGAIGFVDARDLQASSKARVVARFSY